MASVFDVTPEELERSATQIAEKTQAFIQTYKNIYAATDGLRVSYQGQASDTFNQRIEGYRNDFTAAAQALADYIQFLQSYAARLRGVEDDLKARASTLSSGK